MNLNLSVYHGLSRHLLATDSHLLLTRLLRSCPVGFGAGGVSFCCNFVKWF